ncbi:MAG: hypothetical protein ACTHMY_25240 [Solirubrobacteraceae bacterium]
MGLLDDAIREHLDLKRRRGGDPTEIERAEREALGPVRRGPELTGEEEVAAPEQPSAHEADHSPAPTEAAEQWEPFREDPELRELEEPEELTPYQPARAPDGDPLMDDEPFSGETHDPVQPEPADVAPAPAPEPEPPLPHPADPPPAAHDDESRARVDQETEEYELEPEEEVGDDVLESTPEFLQDAPEHDRLWFEQRPPRDFDFDG